MADEFHHGFISYGRADSKAFATHLHQCLIHQGLKIWFDQNDIPLAVDFQDQIDDGIEKSDNFLFIIAPHSVNSRYCRKEIDLAIQCNKRIIPLLHVEQITQETWQQRNPTGTDAEWQAYQAQGLHSSFTNMHPEIGKINWVYFREGIDDFATSLAGLLEIFDRHRPYVRQHTYFLAKARTWERQQKQSRYLLIAEERAEAEAWLGVQFSPEQPPCEPTDLHCEFISESIKNAHNLMTQVFLCYAEADRAFTDKLRRTLMRERFTVWTNRTDIQTGVAFQQAIRQGIEEADNVVCLISPDAVESEYCQQELAYALAHHKRIIPLLVRATDLTQLSPSLRSLQFINFMQQEEDAKYQADVAKLIRALRQDATYYEEHKLLLAKALKWERQHHNPSILLRGYNLRRSEAWLKVAQGRSLHPPTPLQAAFIAASLQQPSGLSLDVFVSYSRTDSDLARRLNDALQAQGKTTWFDQESIASGTDFQQEIYRGIETCNNFLFILSPSSVKSPYCATEVEYAAKLNKRCVTVLYRPIDPADLHPELARMQWIEFQQPEDFSTHFSQLIRTLDTDREHVNSHTKWSQRAIEWVQKDRSEDLLLRGSELAIASNWLQEAEIQRKQPAPTPLHQQFIAASGELRDRLRQQDEAQRQKQLRLVLLTLVSAIGGFLAVGFTLFLTFQTSQQVVAGLVSRLGRAISGRTQQQVIGYVSQPLVAQRRTQEDIQNQALDARNFRALERYFLRQAQNSPLLNSIYFADAEGRFIGIKRGDKGELLIQHRNSPTAPNRLIYRVDAAGNRGPLIGSEPFDPRTRAWFTQAIKTKQSFWSSIYSTTGGKKLGIQTSTPIYRTSDNALVGVLGLNLDLDPLNNFLKSLDLSPHAVAFIMERSGDIVATSTATPLIPDATARQLSRLNVSSDRSSPLIQAASQPILSFTQQLTREQLSGRNRVRIKRVPFSVGPEQYTAQLVPIQDAQGLEWFLVLIIPEEDFLQDITANQNLIIFIGFAFLGTLFFVSGLGIPVYRWILRTLRLQPTTIPQANGSRRLRPILVTGVLVIGGVGVLYVGWWVSWLNPSPNGGHQSAVSAVQFAIDGRTAYSSSTDHAMLRWDVQRLLSPFGHKSLGTIGNAGRAVRVIQLEPGRGDILAAGLENGEIQLWDALEKQSQPIAALSYQPDDRAMALTFTTDARTLFSGHGSGTVLQWDLGFLQSNDSLITAQKPPRVKPMDFAVTSLRTVGTQPGNLAIAGQFNRLVLWNWLNDRLRPITPAQAGSAEDFITRLATAPTQPNRLVSANNQGTIQVWDLTACLAGTQACQLVDSWKAPAAVRSLALTANGCYLASGSEDGQVTLWPLTQAGQRAAAFLSGKVLNRSNQAITAVDVRVTDNQIFVLKGEETGLIDLLPTQRLPEAGCDTP